MGKFRHMAKADRLNQKLWAEGVRETVMVPHIGAYADALARSNVAERDYIHRVQNEYHQLFDWRLKDDEEPDLPIPKYNPYKIAPDEVLTAEDALLKSQTISRKNKVANFTIRPQCHN